MTEASKNVAQNNDRYEDYTLFNEILEDFATRDRKGPDTLSAEARRVLFLRACLVSLHRGKKEV